MFPQSHARPPAVSNPHQTCGFQIFIRMFVHLKYETGSHLSSTRTNKTKQERLQAFKWDLRVHCYTHSSFVLAVISAFALRLRLIFYSCVYTRDENSSHTTPHWPHNQAVIEEQPIPVCEADTVDSDCSYFTRSALVPSACAASWDVFGFCWSCVYRDSWCFWPQC